MMVFGRSFQNTFLAFAFVGLSNWGFWLPAGLLPAPGRIAMQQRFAGHPPQKPAVRLSSSAVAKSNAKISVVAASGNGTNESASLRETKVPGELLTPSLSDDALIHSAKQTETVGKAQSQASNGLGALSPAFIENRGQFDEHVKFQLRGNGKTVWLTDKGLVFDFLREKSDGSNKELHPSDSSINSPIPAGVVPPQKASMPHDVERLVFNEEFLNANPGSNVEAIDPQQGTYNFISGNDPTKWHTHVQAYGEVVYPEVWDGIDVRVFRNGSDLEQEFIVRPGGDLSRVQITYRGIDGLSLTQDGSLEINTAFGKIRETAPRIYQEIAGRRVAVGGRFKLLSETTYRFEVSKHPAEYALVIDPTLLYSTFLGGSAGNSVYSGNHEVATGIAVDSLGSAYVTGYTASQDFPVTTGAFLASTACCGQSGFLTKLNSTGSAFVYSTYLEAQYPNAIAVDASGNAYVTGYGVSSNFATTPNAYWPANSQQPCATNDAFVTELNPTGSQLLYSTCLSSMGSSNTIPSAIALDSLGHAFIAGATNGPLQTTSNAYQSSYTNMPQMAFVTEFDMTASGTASLIYSTYLGVPPALNFATQSGPGYVSPNASASGIAIDSFGMIYLTGSAPLGFPVTTGAFQTSHAACIPNGIYCTVSVNSFVSKLDPSASGPQSLIYSTFFGGMGQTTAKAIAVDSSGAAYLTGSTSGSYYQSFPLTSGAFQTTAGQSGSASFVTKFNAAGSQLVYSTFVSDLRSSSGNGIAVDSLGNAYIAGQVNGSTFPVTPDAFQSTYLKPGCSTDCASAFLAKVNPGGSALIYSSYLGGSWDDGATALAIDHAGDVYLTGWAGSADFPSTPFAFQPALNPNPSTSSCDGCHPGDAFVTKFPLASSGALSVSSIFPISGGNAGTVTAEILGTGFHSGATASLDCASSQIVGTNTIVQDGGRIINSSFSLIGTIPNACSVTVVNPDSSSTSLPAAFTVVEGGAPNIQINKIGTAAVVGRNMTYVITVSNIGNSDSNSVPVTEVLEPWFTFVSSNPPPSNITALADLFPEASLGQTYQGILEWDLNSIPPGTTKAFTYVVKLDSTYPSGLPVHGLACEGGKPITCEQQYGDCIKDISSLSSALACAGGSASGWGACVSTEVAQCAILLQVCKSQQGGSCQTVTEDSEDSDDPNHISGLPGVGAAQWVSGKTALSYAISFTNESTATASAQQVIVTDAIDPSSDLNTLQLTGVNLLGIQVPIPSTFQPAIGANEFATNVDLRPVQNLLIKVDATLDPVSRILTWTFTSIDPTTGQLPLDASVGFLPPGASGSVFYTVNPKAGLPTGSQISDQATILFDSNAPMSTPVWINSIDNTAPVSKVASLPPTEPSTGFTVNWAGTDVGAGIQGFTIFTSDSGGPFIPWLTSTAATSATFTGQLGHTYAFYSIAQDLVGNVETAKSGAEATTIVSSTVDSTPPVTTATVSPNPNVAGWSNSNVTVTLNATDNAGGSGVKEIHHTMSGGQSGGNVLSGSSTSLIISSEGITTITYFAVDNAGNFEAAKSVTIKLDKTPPTIMGSKTPSPNTNGWNNTPVTVSFQCSDALSGLAAGSPPAPTMLSTQGAGQSVNGKCTDLAGNMATAIVPGINIDTTPPILTAALNPPPNGIGWNNTNVTVTWTAVDALSGVSTVSAPVTVATEGKGQIVTGNAADRAGNLVSGSVAVNVDKTPPEALIQFDPTSKDVVLYGVDTLSGAAQGPVAPLSVVPLKTPPDPDDMDLPDGPGVTAERRTYRILDLAGNPLLIVEKVKKGPMHIAAKIISLQYGQGAVIPIPPNRHGYLWTIGNTGSLQILTQHFLAGLGASSPRVDAIFNAQKNQTTIQLGPVPKSTLVKPGLVLLQMATAGGKLSIRF